MSKRQVFKQGNIVLMLSVRSIQLRGLWLDLLNKKDFLALVSFLAQSRQKVFVGNHNLHSAFLYFTNSSLHSLYSKASLIHIDGMPLVWLAKIFGYSALPSHRLGYRDFIFDFLKMIDQGKMRIALIGAQSTTLQKCIEEVQKLHPNIQIEGRSGYFDHSTRSKDSLNYLLWLQKFNAHVVIVGMGMPIQETWLESHWDLLAPAVYMNGGAIVDTLANAVKAPPRWSAKLGIEWLFRLLREPRRLWRRYLIEPFFLMKVWSKRQSVSASPQENRKGFKISI